MVYEKSKVYNYAIFQDEDCQKELAGCLMKKELEFKVKPTIL